MTFEKVKKQIEGTMFQADLENSINVNGADVPRAYYNLVVSIRDLRLFQRGMKPHRRWRLKDVKTYFGLVGGKEKCLEQLEAYKDVCFIGAE
jgi:hypothetical protein